MQTGSDEREVLMERSSPVSIFSPCQYMENNVSQLYKNECSLVVKKRNISEAALMH